MFNGTKLKQKREEFGMKQSELHGFLILTALLISLGKMAEQSPTNPT
jgi:hypothetical protein